MLPKISQNRQLYSQIKLPAELNSEANESLRNWDDTQKASLPGLKASEENNELDPWSLENTGEGEEGESGRSSAM